MNGRIRKASMPVMLVIAVMVFALLAGACTNLLGTEDGTATDSGSGTLLLTLSQPVGAQWVDQPDKDIDKYVVTGSGPNGASFVHEITNGGTTLEVPGLIQGSWTVVVNGYNEAEEKIGSGSVSFSISPNATVVKTVTVSDLQGEGDVDLEITWDAAVAVDSVVRSLKLNGNGSDVLSNDDVLQLEKDNWSFAGKLEAGTYLLTFDLRDSDNNLLFPIVQSVEVVAGLVTEGTFHITEAMAHIGDFDLEIVDGVSQALAIDLQTDIPSAAGGKISEVQSVTVSANPTPADDGSYAYAWYVNAAQLAGESGSSVTLENLSVGFQHITVVIWHGNRITSETSTIEVTPSNIVHPGGSIQAAIDAASNGDVITVKSGTYVEDLSITSSVTLLGHHAGMPTSAISPRSSHSLISGRVDVMADNVIVDGFTLSDGDGGRIVAPRSSDGAIIRNNQVLGGSSMRGIQGDFFGRPTNLTIEGNAFATIDYGIAGTESMTGLSITGNSFYTFKEGIGLGAGVEIVDDEGLPPVSDIDWLFQNNTFQVSGGYAVGDYRDGLQKYNNSGNPID